MLCASCFYVHSHTHPTVLTASGRLGKGSIDAAIAVEAPASYRWGLDIGATAGDGADTPEYQRAGAAARRYAAAPKFPSGCSHASGDHFFELVTLHGTHGGWNGGVVLRANAVAGRS